MINKEVSDGFFTAQMRDKMIWNRDKRLYQSHDEKQFSGKEVFSSLLNKVLPSNLNHQNTDQQNVTILSHQQIATMGVFPNCEVMAQRMEKIKTELDIAYFIWKQEFLEYNQENNSITKQRKLERLRLKLY